MNFKKHNAKNQITLMIIITGFTQVFVLIRNSFLAAEFGVSVELDAFYFANSISTFLFSFVGAAISTIIMPQLRNENNEKPINIFISFVYLLSILFMTILLIFNEEVIKSLSGSTDLYFISLSSKILVFTLIASFFNSLIAMINGILEFKSHFIKIRLVALASSFLIIIGLLIASKPTIFYFVGIILFTTTLNFILNFLMYAKSGYKFYFAINFKDREFVYMTKLFVPIILSQGIYQISILIDTMLVARLGAGNITILTYSVSVINMINILILSNLISYMYPKMIKDSLLNSLQKTLSEFILIVSAIMCFFIVLFFGIGKEGISLLFERGNFTANNTYAVYTCTLIYVISLPSNAARDLIYKYFYLKNDTISPLRNSVAVSVLNIVISILLSYFYGVYGVVLGTTISSFISLLLIINKFNKKFGIMFNLKVFIIENLKILLTTLLSIVIIFFMRTNILIPNLFIFIPVVMCLTIFIYTVILFLMKSKIISRNYTIRL